MSNKFIVEDFKVSDDELDSLDSNEEDSDVELQEALLSGRLKPGLHAKLPFKEKLEINNVDALKSKLNDFKLNSNWSERLDLIGNLDELPATIPNPLKDENVVQENNDLDVIRNDIKREIKFMLQAKSSVLQGLERLHSLKVRTKRPDDYFAEMLKSKEHMDKIKKVKDTKKEFVEKKEKSKLLREQKKMGKKIQQEVLMQRQKEKKEFQEKIKKFRKGNIKSIDFLDDDKQLNKKGKSSSNKSDKQFNQIKQRNAKLTKREFKAGKYGAGGRKRGLKRNTAESFSSSSSFKKGSIKNQKSTKRSKKR